VCFDTQQIPMILGINEDKYIQSCHTSRDDTRAGFDSAPFPCTETGSSSIIKYVRAYNRSPLPHTKQPSLIKT
jgi:hypothetical protein